MVLCRLLQAAAAAMLQQAQLNQANGVPFNVAALQQRLLAAARQGSPNAAAMQGQLPGLFRPQDANANQAVTLAGFAGQMPPPTFNQQVLKLIPMRLHGVLFVLHFLS
jgi:hypothetical protein